MEAKDRIIVALDTDSPERALELAVDLSPHVGCFKFGLELITASLCRMIMLGGVEAREILTTLYTLFGLFNRQIFWDGKLHDIPNTVAGAIRPITKIGVQMLNVHCLGSREMMRAALRATEEVVGQYRELLDGRPLILGVTLLTSLDYDDLIATGILTPLAIADPQEREEREQAFLEHVVRSLALLAQECGLDGVIASPKEIRVIRKYCKPGFLVVTPGVRPLWAAADDQKRIMTPGEAIKAGADYLVIGRPITKPPQEIGTPVDAAKRITQEIEEALKEKEVKQ